jgi:hypothetical protein
MQELEEYDCQDEQIDCEDSNIKGNEDISLSNFKELNATIDGGDNLNKAYIFDPDISLHDSIPNFNTNYKKQTIESDGNIFNNIDAIPIQTEEMEVINNHNNKICKI